MKFDMATFLLGVLAGSLLDIVGSFVICFCYKKAHIDGSFRELYEDNKWSEDNDSET